jgi:hypothetical protein
MRGPAAAKHRISSAPGPVRQGPLTLPGGAPNLRPAARVFDLKFPRAQPFNVKELP